MFLCNFDEKKLIYQDLYINPNNSCNLETSGASIKRILGIILTAYIWKRYFMETKVKVLVLGGEPASMVYCAIPYVIEGIVPHENILKKDTLETETSA